MKKLMPPWQVDQDPAAWFKGKSAEELDIIEHGGQPLYSEVLRRQNPAKDQAELVRVRVRVPNHFDKMKARVQALMWAKDIAKGMGYKVDGELTIQQAEAILGGIYFDQLDSICILSLVTYEHDKPEELFFRYDLLQRNYTLASLMDLWERLCFYQQLEDVRSHDIDEDKFIAVVAAIDQARNISPLLALDGFCRDRFVTTMASRLSSYLTPKSSSPSTGRSTPSQATSAESTGSGS